MTLWCSLQNYKPGYIVTLHTIDKQGQPKDITFACSVEELTVRTRFSPLSSP